MSQPFDYFKFSCAGNVEPRCSACPRDFVIQSSAIIGVFKDRNGKAVLSISPFLFLPHPQCSERLRMVEVSQDYSDVVEILNGNLYDFGDIMPVYYKDA